MDPIPATSHESGRARAILLSVAAIGALLFVAEARSGRVVRGADGNGYYAWLRSAVVDGDWDFDNEWDTFAGPRAGVTFPNSRTPTDRRSNPYSVGPAIAWAGPISVTHFMVRTTGVAPADGYSGPYQFAVGLTTFIGFLLTIAFTFGIARRFATPVPASIATAGIVLATPVVAYGTIETSMAHGLATSVFAGFLYGWLATAGRRSLPQWFGLGLLLGVAALMRWQLVTYSCLLAFDAVRVVALNRFSRPSRTALIGLALAAGGTVIAFTPQLFAWQRVYGSPFGGTHSTMANWLSPSLFAVLVSPDRGLFAWSPVLILAVTGSVLSLRNTVSRPTHAALLLAAGLQAYFVATVWGPGVFLGWSFGFRILTESCVPAVVGLAAFLAIISGRVRAIAVFGLGALIAANLILLQAYRFALFGETVSGFGETVWVMGRVCVIRPLEGTVILAVVALLTAQFVRALTPNENRGARPRGSWLTFIRRSSVT